MGYHRYIEARSQRMDESLVSLTIDAFHGTWPCRGTADRDRRRTRRRRYGQRTCDQVLIALMPLRCDPLAIALTAAAAT
jgi:hypothetical protein